MAAFVALDVLRDEAIAVYVLVVIALPLLAVFLHDRTKWWVLIPAYVLLAERLFVGLIGLGVLGDLLFAAYVLFAIAIRSLWLLPEIGGNGGRSSLTESWPSSGCRFYSPKLRSNVSPPCCCSLWVPGYWCACLPDGSPQTQLIAPCPMDRSQVARRRMGKTDCTKNEESITPLLASAIV